MTAERYVRDHIAALLRGELTPRELAGLTAEDLTKLTQLGLASFTGHRYEQAKKIFELMISLDDRLYVAHHYLGMTADRLGELPRAATAYARAASLLEALPSRTPSQESTLADVMMLLADVFMRLGRKSEACVLLVRLAGKGELARGYEKQIAAYLARLQTGGAS